MKPTTLFLAVFVASVQAAIPTPSLTIPTDVPSLTKTASASTSTSSQIPKCVINCAGSSIASSGSKCASIQDTCVCTDTKFQDAMTKCLKSCTTSEQLAAKALQKSICAAMSSSNSTTMSMSGATMSMNNGTSDSFATATGSGTANTTASTTANTTLPTSSASQSGNSALAVQIEFAQSTILALTVAVASAVMGGLLI